MSAPTEATAAAVTPPALVVSPPALRVSTFRRGAAWALRYAWRFAFLAGIVALVRIVFVDQYYVPTASMWPTITPGDRIVVSKAAYGIRRPFDDGYVLHGAGPAVGDVVVFRDPRGGAVPLVKRVVAVAGQKVSLRKGVLYIDGSPQKLETLAGGRVVEHLGAVTHGSGARDLDDYGPTVVPAGHIFMMGDNRRVSLDSRELGAVSVDLVRGRVLGTLFHEDGEGVDLARSLHMIQ